MIKKINSYKYIDADFHTFKNFSFPEIDRKDKSNLSNPKEIVLVKNMFHFISIISLE